MLLAALAVFTAASALCALAQTMPQLIGARALQGLGGGGLMTLAQALISESVPPRDRGRYQGYFATLFAVASAVGPVRAAISPSISAGAGCSRSTSRSGSSQRCSLSA